MKSLLIITFLVLSCYGISFAQNIVLTCDSPIQMYNNHVGYEWKFGFGVNRTFVPAVDPVSVPLSSVASLEFIIQELDKYTDQAIVSLDIDPASLQFNKLYSRTIELIVTENAGQYKGNTAKWSVTIHYKKVNARA